MGRSAEAKEGQAKLFRILSAYAEYNPQIGYCQGKVKTMSLLAFTLHFLMQGRDLRQFKYSCPTIIGNSAKNYFAIINRKPVLFISFLCFLVGHQNLYFKKMGVSVIHFSDYYLFAVSGVNLLPSTC